MDWIEIERDENGFTTDGFMIEMYEMLPIAVLHEDLYAIELVCKENWLESVSDLEGKPYLTHYCQLPQLPIIDGK